MACSTSKKFSDYQQFRFELKLQISKNWSLWFLPQKMCKFLSNSVRFLDTHSRYTQNDSFTLGPTSFLKKSRIFRSLGGSCEKWQPISWRMSWFNPPAPERHHFFPQALHLNREWMINLPMKEKFNNFSPRPCGKNVMFFATEPFWVHFRVNTHQYF